MAHSLISIVGKGHKAEKTTYDFEHGDERTGSLFGPLLLEHLRDSKKASVDRVVFVGTAGSNFDLVAWELGLLDDATFDLVETIETRASENTIDVELLQHLRISAEKKLSCSVDFRIVPDGRDLDGQLQMLEAASRGLERDDRINLDVTHGLRHLPMLAILAGLYLRAIRGVEIEAVWYGAFDLKEMNEEGEEIAPVLRLDGLLHLADWIAAFAIFEHDGAFGTFAPLLERDGVAERATKSLEHAAALERMTRISDTQAALTRFGSNAGTGWSKLSGLFEAELRSRLDLVQKGGLYARQRRLANLHLDKGDLLRAAIFGYEAVVTRLTLERFPSATNFRLRCKAEDEYEKDNPLRGLGPLFDFPECAHDHPERAQRKAFHALKHLRNSMAHASEGRDQDSREVLAQPDEVARLLSAAFELLLPKEPPERL